MTLTREAVRTTDIAREATTPVPPGPCPAAAVRFFWTVLAVSVIVSITGNAEHAVLHARTLPVVAAAVAIVPPVALLAAVHGVTVMLRAHARSRLIHSLTTVMTLLIAAGAFRLSFTALRDLAVMAGIAEDEAWIWPVIIEGSMAQATLALLAFAHTPPTARAHGTLALLPQTADTALQAVSPDQSGSAPAPDVHTEAPEVRTQDKPVVDSETWAQIANLVCARDPARRRDPTAVAHVLTRHHEDGWNPSEIAREINLPYLPDSDETW